MKRIVIEVLSLVFSATGLQAASPSPELCTLRVHATGFRNHKGAADAVIFKTPDGWPENPKKAFASEEAPISGKEATITFHLAPGEYGVAVLHDENGNQKLDRNFLGIPVEGFGFSNNPHVFFSAPSFQAATINLGCPESEIHVKMIYK